LGPISQRCRGICAAHPACFDCEGLAYNGVGGKEAAEVVLLWSEIRLEAFRQCLPSVSVIPAGRVNQTLRNLWRHATFTPGRQARKVCRCSRRRTVVSAKTSMPWGGIRWGRGKHCPQADEKANLHCCNCPARRYASCYALIFVPCPRCLLFHARLLSRRRSSRR